MMSDQPLTREAILDGAEQALRRYGPDKTSVIDVARALKVSHGTLYRHFASKASLREAVTERWLRRISDPLAAIADGHQGSAADLLRLWLATLIGSKRKCATDDPEMFAMYAAVTLESVDMIKAHVNFLIAQIGGIIEEGIRTGEFKAGQSEAIAGAVFMATMRFHHPAHAHEWAAPTIDAEWDSVWELILTGIK